MKKIYLFFCCLALALSACDLQPKITSLPDSVGDFISARYPTLLADPEIQPDIYDSAASDYGIYASSDLYGSVESGDYVLYASADDYTPPVSEGHSVYGTPPVESQNMEYVPAQEDYLQVPMYGSTKSVRGSSEIVVARGDTVYSLAQRYGTTTDVLVKMNDLQSPYLLTVGQKIKVPVDKEAIVAQPTETRIAVNPKGAQSEWQEITIAPGDTLYSLSRQYSVPVNDVAVINNLNAPFALSVGQKIKVPKQSSEVMVQDNISKGTVSQKGQNFDTTSLSKQQQVATTKKQETKKISSDPSKKLPTIGARSASKFSWPVRGKVLSRYGAKTGGLFNDGINISASRGTPVAVAENGVVAYAGNEVKGMGNLIIVQHSGGWMTVYAHMDSMSVRRGTKVSVGQKIGTVGQTGKVDAPQLHFEIRKGTKAYNPESYLKK